MSVSNKSAISALIATAFFFTCICQPAYSNPFKGFKSFNRKIERSFRKHTRPRNRHRSLDIFRGIKRGVISPRFFDNRIIGVAVGITVGAFIARELSKNLNAEQKHRVTRSTVSTIVTGKEHSWSDKKSKSRGSVKVVKTEDIQEDITVPVYKDKVAEMPLLDFIGETYELKKNANVRGGPDTTYKKTGYFKGGTKLNVVGKVKDAPWYFVSSDGVGIGFVHNDLMKSSSSSIIASKPKEKTSDDTYVAKVAETKLCRTVEQTVTLKDGTTKTEELVACKGANGWEMQTAAS